MKMLHVASAALVAACALSAPAFAGGTIKVSKSMDVAAAPDKTWDAVKDFGGLHTWHPAVEKTDIESGGKNKVGTVRVLSLKGGGTINETLTAHSGRSLSYKINESPLPVSDYKSTIAVKPAGTGKSTVVWSSTFKAKGAPDAEAKKTIEGIYDAGLGNLKKQLGG